MREPLTDTCKPAAAEVTRRPVLSCRDPAGDLGKPEDAEGDRDEGDPVPEEQAAEREPLLGGGRGCADQSEQQAQQSGGRPFTLPRDKTAASATPRMVSMKSSGLAKDNTNGLASGIARVRPTAPMRPPAIEDKNASLSARAAWPFLAIE